MAVFDLSRFPFGGEQALSRVSALAQGVFARRATVVVINIGVLALVTYSLAQWTWRWWQPTEPVRPPQMTPSMPTAQYDLSAIQAANLFGVSAARPAAANAHTPYDQVPRTSLNLVLTGLIMRGGAGLAMISVNGKPEESFIVGEAVMPGVMLESVHPDRVLIQRGGARESVILKELTEGLAPGSIASGAVPAAPRAINPGNIVKPMGSNRAAVNRELMRQQLQKPEFLSQALIVPNPGGGFQVREVQAGSVYEKLGLRAGDVIRTVNGQPVNNMDEAMRLYQQFADAGQVSVEVMRAGKSEMLQYDLH